MNPFSSRMRLRLRMAQRQRKRDSRMAKLISREIAAVLPKLVIELNQIAAQNGNSNGKGSSGGKSNGNGDKCTYKHFKLFISCDPVKFTGTDEAIELLQWFESIENIFFNCNIPDELRVQFALSVFQNRALTWWMNLKRTKTVSTAGSIEWVDFKALMIKEFCPPSELKKIEAEFLDLAQDSGENDAYVTHFHEYMSQQYLGQLRNSQMDDQ